MKLSIETKVYAFFCAAFAGVVILGFVAYQSTRDLIVNDSWVSHTHQVRQSLADLLSAVLGAETSRQDYLLTGDSQYRVQFLAGLDQIRPDVRKITQLTADNPDQKNKFDKLTALTEQILSIWAGTADAARAAKIDGAPIPPVAREFELRVCVADLSALVDEMNKAEENLLQTRSGTARRSGKRAIAIAILGGGFSTLVVLFAMAILHRDLAKRRRAEEALRRREAELKEAQRVAAVGSWEWAVKTDTVTWSEELYHIAGRDPRDPVPNYTKHAQLYAPESWRRLQSAVERVLKTGMSYELDLQMIRPDGTTRWIAARGEAERDITGRITRLRGTGQDITERKRAGHKIQEQANLLGLASDAILVRDLDEKILFWNKSAERHKDPDKGTGLGLSTVLGIVKSHRGHVEFDSKWAQGTEFRIYLPAEPGLQDPLSTKQRTAEALPRGRGELVLIVDDEEAVRSVMKRILESHGYRTVAATRGTEAVACYVERGTEISVVLTDLHMPDMGGAEAIAVLRELNPRIRIIVATGAGSPLGATSVHELGVQAYIKKPFDLAHLLGTLQRVLHQEKVR